MAWRRRNTKPALAPGERASIGDAHVDVAIGVLEDMAKRSVATQTKYGYTRDETIAMLFDPTDITHAQNARGIVSPQANVVLYRVAEGVDLGIDFAGCPTLAIDAARLSLQPCAAPLIAMVEQVSAIHYRFEEAKAALRWLNRHATPGAIRYYWPSAMQLTKDAPIWRDLQEVPSRYNVPPGIGLILQSLKDAAATVSGALLLPDTTLTPRDKMWLRFTATTRYRAPADMVSSYTTDTVIYNL